MTTNNTPNLRSGRIQIGSWLSSGSPVVAELAALSGLSWLLVDLEHGASTEAGLYQILQSFRGTRCASIVRPGAPRADLILKALDWGADGLMFPHISYPEEAETCVKLASYPPRGKRGFSSSARVYQFGLIRPEKHLADGGPFLIMQIETLEGVENVEEIAGVDGVDALFVGPSDLTFDLSHRGDSAPSYDQCLEKVAAAAEKAAIPWGLLTRGKGLADIHLNPAPTLIAIDSDLGIIKSRFQELVEQFASQS